MNIKGLFKVDSRIIKYLWIIFALLLIDHTIKLITYSSLDIHEEIKIIGDLVRIQLELNDGTSFSVPFQNETDRFLKISLKIFLSIILFFTLLYFINKKVSKMLLLGLSLSFAGTLGNLIDRVFYGAILNNAIENYTNKWFHGRVIDMFSINLFEIQFPRWVPIIGGNDYIFFEPIFNFADLILFIGGTVSIFILLKNRNKQNFAE